MSLTTTVLPATGAAPAIGAAQRVRLETLRTECAQEHAQALAAAAQYGADPVVWARCTSLQGTLAEIDAALARIEAGTYGACLHCGSAIPAERLELRPFASSCVACSSAR